MNRTPASPNGVSTTVLAVATAVLALLAAACSGRGGSGSATASGPSRSASTVGYSACVRSHGVPNFPDPDIDGQLPKVDAQRLGVSSSQLRAAQQACQHLLPNDSGAIDASSIQQCIQAGICPQALMQHLLSEERRFAQCMRSREVPRWPDPSIDRQGRPVFVISISKLGFDPYSRQVWAKGDQCSHLMPDLPGLPAAVSP
jgi:hypothetical protein